MRAGRLRRRVKIEEKSVVQDSYGAETITWSEVGTFWTAVEPLRGDEFLEQRRRGAEVTTRIVMRYLDEIAPEMRATWDGHTYDIVAVIDVDGRHRELQLMVRETI